MNADSRISFHAHKKTFYLALIFQNGRESRFTEATQILLGHSLCTLDKRKRNQIEYVDAAKSWSSFQDKLPDSGSNKIPIGLCRIMLQSHLYELAKDLSKDLPLEEIESDEGVEKICKTLDKKGALTAVSNAYTDFPCSPLTKRGSNESFHNFESRFAAATAKMKSHGSMTLPESLAAFILLANTNIDTNQRISIFSAATSHSQNSERTTSDDELIDSVKYDPIASIFR